MSTYAYLRVSTVDQDLQAQRKEIEDFCRKNERTVDHWLAVEMSSRKNQRQRRIEELLAMLKKDDTVIVSELSRLGRSISGVIVLVESLIKKKINFISIKQNMILNGKMDIQTKVMVTMFSLFAEVERDLISQRTKMGLRNAKARGVRLGNPNIHQINRMKKDKALEFAESLRAVLEGFVSRSMTQRSIVHELNRLGIRTRSGGEWSLIQLQNVLDRLGLKTARAKT